MPVLKFNIDKNTEIVGTGGKAMNLFLLKRAGFNVPHFVVLTAQELHNHLKLDRHDADTWKKAIEALDENQLPIADIVEQLGKAEGYAVRSSAMDEDGNQHSFAGQYDSFLYVPAYELGQKIKAVWLSAFSQRVLSYRKKNKLDPFSPVSVIVQVMIPAEKSGVGFGIHPVTGHRKQKLISAVYGLGEGLVSGELDADHYIIEDDRIETQIACKQKYFTRGSKGNTLQLEVDKAKQNLAALNQNEIKAVAELLEKCGHYFERPQDIEFAFYQEQLFLLQSRPITTLHRLPDVSSTRLVWDNSNIIESYPGVTTPLTFSFISASYENAYRLFLGYLGATDKEIELKKDVFANSLGLINGRVYYNLRSWYQMLAMVPGYSINARFMENMMGVKEKFELEDHHQLSKAKAWWRTIKMLAKLYQRYQGLPKKRKRFKNLLDQTIAEYKAVNMDSKNAYELMVLYRNFERKLLNEWKAPLLNDFFAMIAFGRLQKQCEKLGIHQNNPNIHNDLLCGSSDIVSVQPIHRTMAIAAFVNANVQRKQWFMSGKEKTVWRELQDGKEPGLYKMICDYINDFGERCVGELKLETISYVQEPTAFIQVVRNYVQAGITSTFHHSSTEEDLRKNAEAEVNRVLKYRWIKKRRFRKKVLQARTLVSNRENLRYERTRAFGIVRQIFFHIGKNFYAEGLIDETRDIFYLTKEEIFAFISGTSVSQDIKGTISLRKKEYAAYQKMTVPAERFESFGMVYQGNDFYTLHQQNIVTGDIKGIGCCPGIVEAKVKVVTHPQEIQSLEGCILVTSSTDPGWVTLFPSASGIIVERGSLLSHSAIVAREMGIPCIVGVSGLLQKLKTGDTVRMNGSTGEIIPLNS